MIRLLYFIAIAFLFTSCSAFRQFEKSHQIAFNIHVKDTTKDDWEVITMNVDGTSQKNILNNNDVAWTYTSFQDRLFFISDRDTSYRSFFLYETDAKGNHVKKISELQLEDSWMSMRKNGSEMVVSGRVGKTIRFQLFLIELNTGSYKQLTNDTGAIYRDPCFSPDGTKIVFSYQKNKRNRNEHEELYSMNLDGSGLTQLTHYPEKNISAKEYGYKAGAARWHPTENFISYVSKQDGRNSIFAITSDGKKQWKLIENPASDGYHDWSTDGKWLLYNNSDNEEKNYSISLMNWKTKQVKQYANTIYPTPLSPVFIKK